MTVIAEYSVRTALLEDAAIAGIVGTRFYPHEAVPQNGTFPVLTYQRFDREPGITLDAQEKPTGPRLQINALAQTDTAARALAQEVRRFFRGGYSSPSIQLAKLSGGGGLPREPDSNLFGYRVDLVVTMAAAEAA